MLPKMQRMNNNLLDKQVLDAASAPENSTPSILRAPLSMNKDKEMVEQLSKIHPMRNEAQIESNADYLDTEQSVNMREKPTNHPSPWTINEGESLQKVQPLKADLILPQPSISFNNNVLMLDEADYIPVSKGWGFSLLGFFIGRFPSKEAVKNLTARWKFTPLISYHPKGWIVFRFQKKREAELILSSGPYTVFGISMVLGQLPPEFRFDSSPQLQFKVWAKLPNLPLELWNPSAIAKIATVVGSPIEVDYSTASKNYIDGPRVLILVDATQQPPENITVELHNGNSFTQNILLENYPFFCTHCRRAGHRASSCRAIPPTNNGMRNPTLHHITNVTDNVADKECWQQVRNQKNGVGRSFSRRGTNRSLSRAPNIAPPRSVSRPHKQQWVPKNSNVAAATTTNRGGYGIPKIINNTHTVFESVSPPHDDASGKNKRIVLSNQFQPFDELEQPEDLGNNQPSPQAATPIIMNRSSPAPTEPGVLKNQGNQHTKSSAPAANEQIPVHQNTTESAESSGSTQAAANNKKPTNQKHLNGNKNTQHDRDAAVGGDGLKVYSRRRSRLKATDGPRAADGPREKDA